MNFLNLVHAYFLASKTLVLLDYGYMSFGLLTLIIRSLINEHNQAGINLATFIVGAVAIALRFTKANGDYILASEEKDIY